VQRQLWSDLEYAAVSGVQVTRELARLHGAQRASMPIVFTSLLTNEPRAEPRAAAQRDGNAGERTSQYVYGITQTSQVWLDHQVFETANGALGFNWDAVEEIFPPGLLDDMFGAYCALLRRLVDDEQACQQPRADLLAPAYRALQQEVNATDAPLSAALLHELFEERARLQPAAVALISEGRTLTYGELRQRARRLGAELQARGARPNALVAVVMDKGWEQVVATLGVLYAGAAYVPIDPGLPCAWIGNSCRAASLPCRRWSARPKTWPTSSTPRARPACPRE
jgi:non-ribosomal peptide synthetase component F